VGSWTVYEQDSYPHRSFGLEVVVQVVLAVVLTGATLDSVAAKHMCSRDSVRRWVQWVEGLADPASVQRLCLRIDPDGLPAAAPKASGAERILQLLERLADLLAQRGVPLPPKGSGLVRILADRLARFGEVLWLTKSSPPLREASLGAWV
jgi:transposase-like protein